MRSVRLRARGLVTNPNKLDPDELGLETATDLVSERPGVLRPRRGFGTGVELTNADTMHKLIPFPDVGAMLVHWDEGGSSYKLSYSTNGTSFNTMSSNFEAPSTRKMRGCVVAENLYLTSSTGILRVDDNWAPEFAGAPAGIGFDRAQITLTTDTAGPLGTEKQVAYRYCLSFTDDQGRIVRGAPSGRMVVRNTSAADVKRVTVRALLPKKNGTASTALTTSYTLTVYRSGNSTSLTGDTPEDERVIYESKLTSGQISNGYVDVTDTTPDDLRGSAMPENKLNDGIAQSNYAPLFAKEVASWKGCLVGLNFFSRWQMEFQILSVLGSHGIQDTDELTINDGTTNFTITGKTTPGASSHYQLENTGAPSLDIELTAQNIVSAINRHASNTICYAHYAGIPGDVASLGKIVLEARTAYGAASFGVAVGSGDKTNCFEPVLTTTYTDTQSTRDEWPDGWFISKPGAPDAVPLVNTGANVGRLGSGEIILCAAALEDSLFVFTNKSTWRVTGDPPTGYGDLGTLRFEMFRSTLRCIASESVQAVAGAIYALTNQGVVAINDSGVRVVSLDIEDLIREFTVEDGEDYVDEVETTAFAVGHDTERQYILWLYSEAADSQTAFVYNIAADAWTTWDVEAECVAHNPDTDKLWIARNTSGGAHATFHVQKDPGNFSDATSTTYQCEAKWLPVVEPHGLAKQFVECKALFDGSQPSTLTVTTATEIGSASTTVSSNGLGFARTLVPRTTQRGHKLSVSVAITSGTWELAGVIVGYRVYGERIGE